MYCCTGYSSSTNKRNNTDIVVLFGGGLLYAGGPQEDGHQHFFFRLMFLSLPLSLPRSLPSETFRQDQGRWAFSPGVVAAVGARRSCSTTSCAQQQRFGSRNDRFTPTTAPFGPLSIRYLPKHDAHTAPRLLYCNVHREERAGSCCRYRAANRPQRSSTRCWHPPPIES